MKALRALFALGIAFNLVVSAGTVGAQEAYPSKPIKWIVPFPAGGGTDVIARIIAQQMSTKIGQPVVVDNKPGAGSMIGAQALATAAPDGYTIGTVDMSTVALNPNLYSSVPYNSLKDFTYIGGTNLFPYVLVVRSTLPVKNLQELIALAKKEPGKLTYGSGGPGGPNHLGIERLQRKVGIQLAHIPYKGDAPAIQDLLGGQIDMYIGNTVVTMPYLSTGKLRAIAVGMPERLAVLPDVPTFAEAGVKDYDSNSWQGLAAPAHLPAPVAKKLTDALAAALASDEVKQKFREMGVLPFAKSGPEFARQVSDQLTMWREVITSANIKLD